MGDKPKVAFYWCASCGGCEETVIDLNEDILPVVEAVDIVFWPCAMDPKYDDVEAMEDGEIAVCFINGAVRTSEHEEIVKLLRRKSQFVVAFGACAASGGVPGLANFSDREGVLECAYLTAPSNENPENITPEPESTTPQGDELELPEFYDTVKALDQVIDVDYYVPGCPPIPEHTGEALNAFVKGNLPSEGSYLAGEKTLCDTCERNESKPETLSIEEIKRPHQVEMDPEKCFLEEGVICMGPATRGGCGELCINVNMPCRGCFGPPPSVEDQGAAAISFLTSLLGLEGEEGMDEEKVKKLIDSIPDPSGTFYRFSLPKSILRRKREE